MAHRGRSPPALKSIPFHYQLGFAWAGAQQHQIMGVLGSQIGYFHRAARYCRRSLFQQRHARALQNRSDSALAPATKPGALRCINDTTKSPNPAEFTQDGQGRQFPRSPMASERPRRFGCGPGFSTSSDSPRRADVIAFVPVVPADGTSKSN